MSINIHIVAERKISFKGKNGKKKTDTQRLKFNEIQTPTSVTKTIMAAADKKQAYIDYIKTLSRIEREPVYAEDDLFCERKPIGYEEVDWTVEHIKSLEEWINDCEENGYTIIFEDW